MTSRDRRSPLVLAATATLLAVAASILSPQPSLAGQSPGAGPAEPGRHTDSLLDSARDPAGAWCYCSEVLSAMQP